MIPSDANPLRILPRHGVAGKDVVFLAKLAFERRQPSARPWRTLTGRLGILRVMHCLACTIAVGLIGERHPYRRRIEQNVAIDPRTCRGGPESIRPSGCGIRRRRTLRLPFSPRLRLRALRVRIWAASAG